MPWTIYGILIIFGLFVLLMIFNPRLSCFGKRIASPLYPLLRKKKAAKVRAEDYGFRLSEGAKSEAPSAADSRSGRSKPEKPGSKGHKKPIKTHDYGFHLGGPDQKDKKEASGRQTDESGG